MKVNTSKENERHKMRLKWIDGHTGTRENRQKFSTTHTTKRTYIQKMNWNKAICIKDNFRIVFGRISLLFPVARVCVARAFFHRELSLSRSIVRSRKIRFNRAEMRKYNHILLAFIFWMVWTIPLICFFHTSQRIRSDEIERFSVSAVRNGKKMKQI